MAFDPSRLYAALQNTKLQSRDNPTYQVIHELIRALTLIALQLGGITGTASSSTTIINNPTKIIQGFDGIDGEDAFPTLINTGSSLTLAQIMARILLEEIGGSSGTLGAQGAQGTQGIQGIQGVQGIQGIQGAQGIDGEDADNVSNKTIIQMTDFASGDQVLHANFKPDTTQCFSWQTKSINTVVQAPCDGFAIGIITESPTGTGFITGLSDSSNPPTTTRAGANVTSVGSQLDSLTMPVKKGDFWKITVTVTSGSVNTTIFWVPLGVLG